MPSPADVPMLQEVTRRRTDVLPEPLTDKERAIYESGCATLLRKLLVLRGQGHRGVAMLKVHLGSSANGTSRIEATERRYELHDAREGA